MAYRLTREQILEAQDRPLLEVEVPEWGGSVFIRSVTAREREKFEETVQGPTGKGRVAKHTMRARFLALTLADQDGNALFTEADAEKLAEKSAKAVVTLFDAAWSHNGLGKKDADELEKNSETTPPEDSGSS